MALKLNRLGWTQEEIADKVGLDRTTVTKIVKKFSAKEIHNAFEEGKSVEEIAEKVGLAGRSSVNKVLKKFSIKEIQQAFKEGKSVEEIAVLFKCLVFRCSCNGYRLPELVLSYSSPISPTD